MSKRRGDVEDGTDRRMTRILRSRIIAIVRLKHAASPVAVASALADGGIDVLEFTLTTPGALAAIEQARNALGENVVIGAGTVRTAEEARRCIDAGAQFVVSPGLDTEVVSVTKAAGALSLPGAFTPTEVMAAERAGADAIKIFPARSLGPRYIADLLAPLPHLLLVPTGGVDESNAAAYLEAGAIAVGVGSNLIDERSIEVGDWAGLIRRAREMVAAVNRRAQEIPRG